MSTLDTHQLGRERHVVLPHAFPLLCHLLGRHLLLLLLLGLGLRLLLGLLLRLCRCWLLSLHRLWPGLRRGRIACSKWWSERSALTQQTVWRSERA